MPRRGLYSQSARSPVLCLLVQMPAADTPRGRPGDPWYMANSSEILYAVPIMSRLQRLFVVLSWGAAFTMASACKDREQSAPERTEPWRRDQAEDSTKQTQTINYRVLPGARLQLALPTRRAAPQGTFTQVSGELSLDLNQLQFTRGRVLVHLPSLTMNDA